MTRVAVLEKVLEKKKCSACGERRLIQRRPRNYKEVRCLNCGKMFRLRHT